MVRVFLGKSIYEIALFAWVVGLNVLTEAAVALLKGFPEVEPKSSFGYYGLPTYAIAISSPAARPHCDCSSSRSCIFLGLLVLVISEMHAPKYVASVRL